jgi:cytidylate kinase
MREFGPEYLRTEDAEKFWQDLYCKWACTLDMIVWLDAADFSLLERIRTRDQDHIVKNESEPRMIEFLERYRRAYDFTVSELSAKKPGIRILRVDTSKQKTEEIVDRMLVEIGLSKRTR